MSKLALRVKNLSKYYRIGQLNPYLAMHEVLEKFVRAPFLSFSKINNLSLARKQREATSRKYIWALKDVSFDVMHGEVVGIIGPNGAGKSVLLKILSRITKPTEGSAKIYGRVSSMLEVGTGFHPELTGRENIYLNGTILGMKKAEINRKFDRIVAFSEVEKFLDTPVKRYSSGMHVRLAFAVAAHLEAKIMLIDEVLAVGDESFQQKCVQKIKDLASEGRTILFVSYNIKLIKSLCARTIFLSNGRIYMDGDTQEVVSSYLTYTEAKTQ